MTAELRKTLSFIRRTEKKTQKTKNREETGVLEYLLFFISLFPFLLPSSLLRSYGPFMYVLGTCLGITQRFRCQSRGAKVTTTHRFVGRAAGLEDDRTWKEAIIRRTFPKSSIQTCVASPCRSRRNGKDSDAISNAALDITQHLVQRMLSSNQVRRQNFSWIGSRYVHCIGSIVLREREQVLRLLAGLLEGATGTVKVDNLEKSGGR